MFEFPCFYGFKLVHTRVGQAVHFHLAQLCHQKSGSGKNWDFGKIGLWEKFTFSKTDNWNLKLSLTLFLFKILELFLCLENQYNISISKEILQVILNIDKISCLCSLKNQLKEYFKKIKFSPPIKPETLI